MRFTDLQKQMDDIRTEIKGKRGYCSPEVEEQLDQCEAEAKALSLRFTACAFAEGEHKECATKVDQ